LLLTRSRHNCNRLPKHAFLRLFHVGGIIGDRLFKFFDIDNDELVSFEEFSNGFAHFYKGTTDEKFSILFRMFDLDNDGFIQGNELELLLNSLFVPMGTEEELTTPAPNSIDLKESKSSGSTPPSSSPASASGLPVVSTSGPDSPQQTDSPPALGDATTNLAELGVLEEQTSSRVLKYVKAILEEAFPGQSLTQLYMTFPQFKDFVRNKPTVSRAIDTAFKLHFWIPSLAGNGLNLTQSPQNGQSVPFVDSPGGDENLAKARAARAEPLFLVPSADNAISAAAAAQVSKTVKTGPSKTTPRSPPKTPMTVLTCSDCNWTPKFCVTCGEALVHTGNSETVLGCLKHKNIAIRCCMKCSNSLIKTRIDDTTDEVKLDTDEYTGDQADEEDEDDFELVDAPEDAKDSAAVDAGVPAWGTVYQLGSGFWKWQDRWAICRQNFLYVFNEAYRYGHAMPRPKQVIFLEGCDIKVLKLPHEGYYGLEIISPYSSSNPQNRPAGTPSVSLSPTNQDPGAGGISPAAGGRPSLSGHPAATTPASSLNSNREGHYVFYFNTEETRTYWERVLRTAAKILKFGDLYTLGRKLGQGKFSTVYEAVDKRTNEVYAVKVIDKASTQKSAADLEAIRCEIAIMKLVKHPFIVRMKDVFDSSEHLHIVMQLTKDDLFDRIHKKRIFPERTARQIIYNLCKGVSYLHSLGIVHRDLKPENILCTDEEDDTKIVIADFGLSQFVGPNEAMQVACGTINYVAPEVLKMQGYGKNVDAWSIGMIAYVLLYGMLPFYNPDKSITVQNTLHKPLTFGRHVVISEAAREFLRDMLQKDPTKRMTVDAALQHHWFKEPNVSSVVVPSGSGFV